jgi:hypothetical protein
VFLRQRDAHTRAADIGEIQRKPAPAGADVEHALAAFDQQLGRDVAFLGELRVVERVVGIFEIGAAVLPVGVEKKRVQASVEIIVMRDVAARARVGGLNRCRRRCR